MFFSDDFFSKQNSGGLASGLISRGQDAPDAASRTAGGYLSRPPMQGIGSADWTQQGRPQGLAWGHERGAAPWWTGVQGVNRGVFTLLSNPALVKAAVNRWTP